MWWLDWRGPPPPHPLFFSSSHLYLPSFISFSVSIHLSDPPLSSRLPLIFVIHPSVLSRRFPLWSNHNNSSPILSIHHLSLLHLNPLLLCLYISLPPSLPPHRYAIFCCAWRIHLGCGRSGSDGYISGGVW